MRRVTWIVAIVMSLTMILAGCGKKDAGSVVNDLDHVISKLDSYQAVGTMELHTGQQPQKYQVEVWYQKQHYYRIALTNENKDVTQIVLRNDDGVFVLTPHLNKSFRFQSDWPENQGQVYLYQSLVKSILTDKDRQFAKADDGSYVFDVLANYQNASLARQKIWLDPKTYAAKKVEVADANGNVLIQVEFNHFEFNKKFEKDSFDMQRNMTSSSIQSLPTMAPVDSATGLMADASAAGKADAAGKAGSGAKGADAAGKAAGSANGADAASKSTSAANGTGANGANASGASASAAAGASAAGGTAAAHPSGATSGTSGAGAGAAASAHPTGTATGQPSASAAGQAAGSAAAGASATGAASTHPAGQPSGTSASAGKAAGTTASNGTASGAASGAAAGATSQQPTAATGTAGTAAKSSASAKDTTTSNAELNFGVIEPNYLPTGVKKQDAKDIMLGEDQAVLLRYSGTYNFNLVESNPTSETVTVMPGDILDLGFTMGVLVGEGDMKTLMWTDNGVEFKLSTADLPSTEMVKVAQAMEDASGK